MKKIEDEEESNSEYWHGLAEIFKEMRTKKREKCFNPRMETAKKLFEENNIEYKLCSEKNAHFNLYKDNKVVMSYWSYTGKCYIPSSGFSKNIGIINCIKKYIKLFREV